MMVIVLFLLSSITFKVFFDKFKFRVWVQLVAHMSLDDFALGGYVLIRETAVTAGLRFDSAILDIFLAGASVQVLEIVRPDEDRVRGRIKLAGVVDGADTQGFITLRTRGGVFARPLSTRASPDDGID